MSLEDAIIELEKQDVDLRSMRPTKRFTRRIVERVAREGDVARPGYAVIPETRWLFGTKARAKRFQVQMMQEVWDYLERNKPHLLRRNTSSILPRNERRRFYEKKELVIEAPIYIQGHERGDRFFHLDYPNQIYNSLLYGDSRNVRGGTTEMFDALRLARDNGYPLKLVLPFIPLKILDDPGFPRHEVQGVIEQNLVRSNEEYVTRIEVDNNQYPLLIFSNRREDGIVHTARRTSCLDTDNGPAVRPIWACNLKYKAPQEK